MKEKFNGKDRGFSLIELIVVMAIMAVLVGILAPAYLKYVEKTRKSTDISAMGEILKTAETIATEEEYHVPPQAQFVVTVNDGTISITVENWDDSIDGDSADTYRKRALDGWKELLSENDDSLTLVSKEWRSGKGKIVGEVDTSGVVKWSIAKGDTVFGMMADYSSAFAGYFSTTG